MVNLRTEHKYLYRRVARKFWVNLLLGLSLIFPTQLAPPSNAERSGAGEFLPLEAWGVIFVIIALGIAYGIYYKHRYDFARWFLRAGAVYALFWFILLLLSTIQNPAAAGVLILWGYWTLNQFDVSNDPGWDALLLVRDIRENNGDGLR